MVDMAAIASAASSLKVAFDIGKLAIGLRDAEMMRSKIIEMQGEISSALASAIAAQTDQMTILQRVNDLEKEMAQLKEWDAKKDNYELKPFAPGAVAYMLKPNVRGSTPPHWLCAQCFENRKKSVLQLAATMSSMWIYHCSGCDSKISVPRSTTPSWLS